MSEARPANVPSPQPAVLLWAILLRGRVYTTSRGRELLSSCNAIPLKTTTAARGGGARGTVAMPPGGGWVLPCLRRARPRAKKSSPVLTAACMSRVPPLRGGSARQNTTGRMATAEQLDAMSPVDRSQLVRYMQASLRASAAASLHCSTQLASTQRAPLKRAPRSVLHSACDATISPTVLTHK